MKRLIVAMSLLATSACSIQTIGAPTGGLKLSAVFDDVQTLVVGHSVQIADVRIGTVTGIRLDGYRARVTMSIKGGRDIPVATTATVAKTSLLGENYVRLDVPATKDSRSGPFLRTGAVITQTSTQPDIEQVSERVAPLLTALGGRDTGKIIDAASVALTGKGKQLNRIVAQASQISDSYAAAGRDLARALDGMARLGRTLAKGSSELDKLPGNINAAADRINADRAQIGNLVRQVTQFASSFNARVQVRHAKRLQTMLTHLDALLASVQRGRDELKALATGILKIAQSPSITYQGRVLAFIWLKGLLPSSGSTTPKANVPGLLAPPR